MKRCTSHIETQRWIGLVLLGLLFLGEWVEGQVISWGVTIESSGFNQTTVNECTTAAACENSFGVYQPNFASSDGNLGNWPPEGGFMFRNGLEARANTVLLRNVTLYGTFICCETGVGLGNTSCDYSNTTVFQIYLGGILVVNLNFEAIEVCDAVSYCLSCPKPLLLEDVFNITSYNTSKGAINTMYVYSSNPVVLSQVTISLEGDYVNWTPMPLLTGGSPLSPDSPAEDNALDGLYLTIGITASSIAGVCLLGALLAVLGGFLLYSAGQKYGRFSRLRGRMPLADGGSINAEEPSTSPPLLGPSSVAAAPSFASIFERYASPKAPRIKDTWKLAVDDVHLVEPPIATGANGIVYRGSYRGLDVAVKVVAAKFSYDMEEDQGPWDGFLREMELLSRLRHPNIVLFMGACQHGTDFWIVTELVSQGSLAALLQRFRAQGRRLAARRVVALLQQIVRGMSYLHGLGVLHRDLKAANVLVDRGWVVKIADFGQAKEAGGALMTHTGTLRWMAPEVLEDSSKWAPSADVWSFGMVILEACTGRLPYAEIAEDFNVLRAIVDRKPPDLSELPKPLLDISVRCLDPSPVARPSFSSLILDFDVISIPDLPLYSNEIDEF